MRLDNSCAVLFDSGGPFWHLCSPGDNQSVIFREREEYVFGMNLVAWCAGKFAGILKIYTFQLMSNHFHFILSGDLPVVVEFHKLLYRRLRRHFALKLRASVLKNLSFEIFPITDLPYLRSAIAYVNRNGYLVDKNTTPFSYQWGANRYYFSIKCSSEEKTPLSSISTKLRCSIFHTHDIAFLSNYFLTDGYVSPTCYCNIAEGESFYWNAHQYFSFVSRQVESFADMANELGDSIIYSDDEIYSAAVAYSLKNYSEKSPSILEATAKIQLAKELKFKYNATLKQIKRILRIDDYVLRELFQVPSGLRKEKDSV